MSDLTKLLVKLSREHIIVELIPWQNPMDYDKDTTGIRINLYKHDKRITGVVEYTELKQVLIDGIEHKINELYEKMTKQG